MRKLAALGTLACVVLMSSCDVNDDIQDNDNRAVCFTSGIAGQGTEQNVPGTRASGSAWTANDAIGIYMVNNKTTDVAMGAANKQYVTALGDGNFAAATNHETYYPQSGKVDFIAYYPWKETGTNGIDNDLYPVNVAVQDNPEAIDLMWAKATGTNNAGYDKNEEQPVSLEFSHQLTKLVFKTIADVSVGTITGMTVTIKGLNTINTFNVKSGALGTNPGGSADITPKTVIDGERYESIILPRKVGAGDNVTIEFRVGNEDFIWKVNEGTEFKGGEEHEWLVTIARTSVQVTGSIKPWESGATGTGTINPWKPGQGGSGIAD